MLKETLLRGSATGQRTTRTYYQKRRVRDRWSFVLLTGPAFLWFMGMMMWPIANMFYVSTLRWRGIIRPKSFAGLDNYVRLLTDDPRFLQALANTGKHLLIGIPAVMPLAFMLGFFLSQRRAGYRALRIIFFAPAMISVAGIALMFTGIYMPDGIINSLLRAVGLDALTRIWLGDAATAMWAVIAADVWGSIGYQSVLFFAALSGAPVELYDAARIDGASYWTVMWRIAFPLVLDFFGVAMMLRTLWILLGSAQIVLLLTQGGPGSHTFTLGYYLYSEAFLSQRLGYSQAIAVFIFFVGLLLVIFIRRATRRDYQL